MPCPLPPVGCTLWSFWLAPPSLCGAVCSTEIWYGCCHLLIVMSSLRARYHTKYDVALFSLQTVRPVPALMRFSAPHWLGHSPSSSLALVCGCPAPPGAGAARPPGAGAARSRGPGQGRGGVGEIPWGGGGGGCGGPGTHGQASAHGLVRGGGAAGETARRHRPGQHSTQAINPIT